jgi:hypothetical protein
MIKGSRQTLESRRRISESIRRLRAAETPEQRRERNAKIAASTRATKRERKAHG